MQAIAMAAANLGAALLVDSAHAAQLAALLRQEDLDLVARLADSDIAAPVYSRLIELRRLQAAADRMAEASQQLRQSIDLARQEHQTNCVRLQLRQQLDAERFDTSAELAAAQKPTRPAVRVYKPGGVPGDERNQREAADAAQQPITARPFEATPCDD